MITDPNFPPEERISLLTAAAVGLSPMHPNDWKVIQAEMLTIGCWAYYSWSDGPILGSLHPNEIEALRQINANGYGNVVFVPWGADFHEIARR